METLVAEVETEVVGKTVCAANTGTWGIQINCLVINEKQNKEIS